MKTLNGSGSSVNESMIEDKVMKALDFFESEAAKLEFCDFDFDKEFKPFFDASTNPERLEVMNRLISKLEKRLKDQAGQKLGGTSLTNESKVPAQPTSPDSGIAQEGLASKVEIGSIAEPAKPSVSNSLPNQTTSVPPSESSAPSKSSLSVDLIITNCVCIGDTKCIYHEYPDMRWAEYNDSNIRYLQYQTTHESFPSIERKKMAKENEEFTKAYEGLKPLLQKGFSPADLGIAIKNNITLKGFGRSNRRKFRKKIEAIKRGEGLVLTIDLRHNTVKPTVTISKPVPITTQPEIPKVISMAVGSSDSMVLELKKMEMTDSEEDEIITRLHLPLEPESKTQPPVIESGKNIQVYDSSVVRTIVASNSCCCVPDKGIFCYDHWRELKVQIKEKETARANIRTAQAIDKSTELENRRELREAWLGD